MQQASLLAFAVSTRTPSSLLGTFASAELPQATVLSIVLPDVPWEPLSSLRYQFPSCRPDLVNSGLVALLASAAGAHKANTSCFRF